MKYICQNNKLKSVEQQLLQKKLYVKYIGDLK
jgi:hypothetical protein